MNANAAVVLVTPRDTSHDAHGRSIRHQARALLGFDTGSILTTTGFDIFPRPTSDVLDQLLSSGIGDPILQHVGQGIPTAPAGYASYVHIRRRPGVADDRAATLAEVLADLTGTAASSWRVRSWDVLWLSNALPQDQLLAIAGRIAGNPLLHQFETGTASAFAQHPAPAPFRSEGAPAVEAFDMNRPDDALLQLSRSRLLSLDGDEMAAIRSYYADPRVLAARNARGLPSGATDVELEMLAQTWSEHCKHKEFRAMIDYTDRDTGETLQIDSLFDTYIAGATRDVAKTLHSWGHDWLVKVFDDNAGVVAIDDDRLFVWKVETHNSPSALDPYGGAITGILGNNRDPFGTGIGGGRLLFNTNVLCFGSPDYAKPLLTGQIHPQRILHGVQDGIEDGGNKMGIPTVNGAVVFDDRYAGKPLVYCGTGAVAPARIDGRSWWEKRIEPGDRIVMAGGRVGKDGIHGATFSSAGLDEDTPRSVVQIGSPITQKLLFDFLYEAVSRGLVRCSTDNGAGGLSSSVGELALLSGGADIQLHRVPLKYDGLAPWEILVSESQERMTLAVDPAHIDDLLDLARLYEADATDIGAFTDTGLFIARYADEVVAQLDLDFLHHGVPRKRLPAEWRAAVATTPAMSDPADYADILHDLLASLNICSREPIIRQYDHEVQGATVVKPLMGRHADGPQDAAVIRLDPNEHHGVAVSCGIAPQYGDIDPYASAAGAFDEAVRQIVAVGGALPSAENPAFWSMNDNFCVPDSAYDPKTNPAGKRRMGALVRMCQATRDLATAYCVPLTSGKDSMKNDFHADGRTISVPPTVLFSCVAGIPDIRRVVTADFKAPGDRIYLLGETYHELGASSLVRLFGPSAETSVPVVRTREALALYQQVSDAAACGLLESCHDLSDGGLAVALVESAIGGDLGLAIELDGVADGIGSTAALFSESHSRFVVSVRPESAGALEALFGSRATALGTVTSERSVRIDCGKQPLVDVELEPLRSAWTLGLAEYL